MSKEILSILNTAYILQYDKDSNGIIAIDQDGAILNTSQIEQLIEGLTNFKDFYSEELLNIERNKVISKNKYERRTFQQPIHKAGVVFIYKELNTNKFRVVATQDFENRFKSLEYEYPTTIEVIAKVKSKDVNLLKEILLDHYHEHHSHNNWFDLTSDDINYFRNEYYSATFLSQYKKIEDTVHDSIICDKCKQKITNLEQDFYYMCMLCIKTFCSPKCAYNNQHYCRM